MFFDRYVALCRTKGVSPSRAAADVGLSNSVTTKWKRWDKPSQLPDGVTVGKLAAYFGVSVDDILGVISLTEAEQKEMFVILRDACNEKGISADKAVKLAGSNGLTNTINSLGLGRMPRLSIDELYAIADVLDCRKEIDGFLGKIKKPAAVESDELIRQTDEIKELLKKIKPEQRESVLSMLKTFAGVE